MTFRLRVKAIKLRMLIRLSFAADTRGTRVEEGFQKTYVIECMYLKHWPCSLVPEAQGSIQTGLIRLSLVFDSCSTFRREPREEHHCKCYKCGSLEDPCQ